jgi:hypothetical protein
LSDNKKVAVIQSNYIPWKGYFDIINEVDEFIIFDEAQYTKNDWRNRNKIITPNGLRWITIPVRINFLKQKINETMISDPKWYINHLNLLEINYNGSKYFEAIFGLISSIYSKNLSPYLSEINYEIIIAICKLLNIQTKISFSTDYQFEKSNNRNLHLINLLKCSNATEYITGPSARSYMNIDYFISADIRVTFKKYGPYPVYKQLHGNFNDAVSIVDLLFNTGINNAINYIRPKNQSIF